MPDHFAGQSVSCLDCGASIAVPIPQPVNAWPSHQPTVPPPDMGVCQITGEYVPMDELVQFQGHRVGLRGKQIILERMRSGENFGREHDRRSATEDVTPTPWQRLGAYAIDWILLTFVALAVRFAAMMAVMGVLMANGTMDADADPNQLTARSHLWMHMAGGTATLGVTVLYLGLMHGLFGRTIGKMATQLHVTTWNGRKIGMSTAFVRALITCWPHAALFLVSVVALQGKVTEEVLGGLLLLQLGLSFVWLAAQVIAGLIDRDRQRVIHDRLTGTRVIWRRYRWAAPRMHAGYQARMPEPPPPPMG
jgi:uncharacterized RDD family membrane protein YckC